jgi:hypothetical protein
MISTAAIENLKQVAGDKSLSAGVRENAKRELERISSSNFGDVKFAVSVEEIPVEDHVVNGKNIIVYRGDMAARKDDPPYIKCCILPAFVEWAKSQGYKKLGYYASVESFWVGSLKRACEKLGVEAVITHPKLKTPPEWANELGDSLHYLKPNMYHANFNISRKIVEADGDGLMIPMGLDMPAFVNLQKLFFDQFPLPSGAMSYVVPTGSGTALSCISLHLAQKPAEIHGVVTRSVNSIRRIIGHNRADSDRLQLHEIDEEKFVDDATWPVTKGWEKVAYTWLREHVGELPQPVCFVNLGR